ncbi:MAG TPA: DUF1080 domain-containing protein [Planctomycetaceae bacterium]|nr:DUF1080 domain-containing protein [Planctomycetaceae bacterium]
MRRLPILCLLVGLFPLTCFAEEPNPIYGDWALTLPTGEAGWLSVSERDGKPHVELMWAVGGVRVMDNAIFKDELLYIELKRKVGGQTFIIRCVGDKIGGKVFPRMLSQPPILSEPQGPERRFSGERMPPLPSKPDLSQIKFGPKQILFNGNDLTGWKVTDEKKLNGWSVKEGVLLNDTPKKDFSVYGDYANLRTEKEFEEFRLHIEFRPPEGGNSGVYLRGMYEVQVVDRESKMQGIQGVGAIFGRIKPLTNAGKPAGEWNTYDITLVDRHVTVVLNGEKVIDNQPVPGPTGGALLSDVTKPGPIFLQGDHTSIEYRNVWIEPVVE